MDGDVLGRLKAFVDYWRLLEGDEKGEAQVFCDRLFQAFGHAGYKEAGATLEYRVRAKGQKTKFADLKWGTRVLLEMKPRGEDLSKHYRQAFDYWIHAVPQRPRYVVLSNFDEFWIYDFNLQLDQPVDAVTIDELLERYSALNFLFPEEKTPVFKNDLVAVTRAAADKVAAVFKSLVARGEERQRAQRFVLQCVMGMFSEDFGLLPKDLFTEILMDCSKGASSYDVIGGLFRQMNCQTEARGGRYKGVRYFNGGLFAAVEPVDLAADELDFLRQASAENWSKVKPAIFGTLFQSSMNAEDRHAYGAHFTSEADIMKVVVPTIERPFRERLSGANTLGALRRLKEDLHSFRVLDPACGSGNFLYLAYLQLRRIEIELTAKVFSTYGTRAAALITRIPSVSLEHFYGIDILPVAVEIAKITLMLAKEIAVREAVALFKAAQVRVGERDLPLDNLDANIRCEDALQCAWPEVDAIIGNPPYQSKNKIQQELGPAYIRRIRARYTDVPGRADYCVYWFRRAHDELRPGGHAGLVGTNTIRQNYSRQGGLDYIVRNGGSITDAVSSQVWSGDAVVHVSIVNWIKGTLPGNKRLSWQLGDHTDSPWAVAMLPVINSSLSAGCDVSLAYRLDSNIDFDGCDQGQTHGHEGFVLAPEEAKDFISRRKRNEDILFPYLIGDELVGGVPPKPGRYVIDFHPQDIVSATTYHEPFERIKARVLPDRQKAADEEAARNDEVLRENPEARVNLHHRNFLNKWWLLSYPRAELIQKLTKVSRYIVCSRVTRRPIFEFVDRNVRPNDALQVFVLEDDYSFGILQSTIHWAWFNARCSTLKADYRYTSNTVFDSFPWPQQPTKEQVRDVADAAVRLRVLRRKIMKISHLSFREMYHTVELPGQNPLKKATENLDNAVRLAYGMKSDDDVLTFLLKLNATVSECEKTLQPCVGPGLPPVIHDKNTFITPDAISVGGYRAMKAVKAAAHV